MKKGVRLDIRKGSWVGVLALVILGSQAWSCAPRVVYVQEPPPPVKVEVKPPKPAPHAVWIPGHWKWNGRRYVWVPGHWELRPKGKTWVPGHWKKTRRGWVWVPGHWK